MTIGELKEIIKESNLPDEANFVIDDSVGMQYIIMKSFVGKSYGDGGKLVNNLTLRINN